MTNESSEIPASGELPKDTSFDTIVKNTSRSVPSFEFSQKASREEDWRASLIEERLKKTNPSVTFAPEDKAIFVRFQGQGFNLLARTSIDNLVLLHPTITEGNKENPDKERVIWQFETVNRSADAFERYEVKYSSLLALRVPDMYLMDAQGRIGVHLQAILKSLGVQSDLYVSLDEDFKEGAFKRDQNFIMNGSFRDIKDIFALFHEYGHVVNPTKGVDRGNVLALPESIDLKGVVAEERNAWATAYRLLKSLRNCGFIQFDDSDFASYVQSNLQTYEEGIGAKARETKKEDGVDLYFTDEKRHYARTKEKDRREVRI